MRKQHILFLFLAAGILAINSCKKDDDLVDVPDPEYNELEVITSLYLTFTDSAGVLDPQTFVFRDPDGEGGEGPTQFDTISLAPNNTYTVTIELKDETKDPVLDITEEVEEEGAEHLFCFTNTDVDIDITRTDSDGTYEVGLESKWVTGATGSGTTEVVLKHQPEVKDGSCEPGDTDIEVDFPIVIQ